MDDRRGPDRRGPAEPPAVGHKRKASRGLRVPNDPIPTGLTAEPADVAALPTADPTPEIPAEFPAIEAPPPAPRAPGYRAYAGAFIAPPAPVVPQDLLGSLLEAPPSDAPVPDRSPVPTRSNPPTSAARSNPPPSSAVPSNPPTSAAPSNPPPSRSVRSNPPAAPSNPPPVEPTNSSIPPAPRAESTALPSQHTDSSDAPATPEPIAPASADGPSPDPDAGDGAILQVRRRIRAIGADHSSPPPMVEESVELAAVEEVVEVLAETVETSDEPEPAPPPPRRTSLPPPRPSNPTPAGVSSLDAQSLDAPSLDEDEEAEVVLDESIEISIGSSPPPPAAHPSLPPPRPPPADAARPSAPAERPAAESQRATVANSDARPRRRQWWEEIFNDDYLRTQSAPTDEQVAAEAEFIEASLGVERGAAILDVGCGVGRQAVELSARGFDVLGMDLSLAMLARASDHAQARGARVNFIQSDMGEMTFDQSFDAAYCVGSSFGFFEEEKNAELIQRLFAALKPGGTLLLEVVNRDYAAAQHPAMTWYEADGGVCMEETTFNWFTSRLEGKRTLLLDHGRQREQKFSMRLYSLHELGKLLKNVGFKVIEVSGHQRTPGAFFGAHSRMLIVLAQRPAAEE